MSHGQPQQDDKSSAEQEISNQDSRAEALVVNPECYSGDFYGHLLEEYKLYVEMVDRVSSRRIQASQFYISLLSALFGVIAILVEKKVLTISESPLLLVVSLLGILLCFIWHININSYKQLNSLKFQVIAEMEAYLPFPCYAREWQILKKKNNQYQRLSKVEKYVPLTIAFLYLGLAFYAIFLLLN